MTKKILESLQKKNVLYALFTTVCLFSFSLSAGPWIDMVDFLQDASKETYVAEKSIKDAIETVEDAKTASKIKEAVKTLHGKLPKEPTATSEFNMIAISDSAYNIESGLQVVFTQMQEFVKAIEDKTTAKTNKVEYRDMETDKVHTELATLVTTFKTFIKIFVTDTEKLPEDTKSDYNKTVVQIEKLIATIEGKPTEKLTEKMLKIAAIALQKVAPKLYEKLTDYVDSKLVGVGIGTGLTYTTGSEAERITAGTQIAKFALGLKDQKVKELVAGFSNIVKFGELKTEVSKAAKAFVTAAKGVEADVLKTLKGMVEKAAAITKDSAEALKSVSDLVKEAKAENKDSLAEMVNLAGKATKDNTASLVQMGKLVDATKDKDKTKAATALMAAGKDKKEFENAATAITTFKDLNQNNKTAIINAIKGSGGAGASKEQVESFIKEYDFENITRKIPTTKVEGLTAMQDVILELKTGKALGTNAIKAINIKGGAVTTAKIENNSVTSAKISGRITLDKLDEKVASKDDVGKIVTKLEDLIKAVTGLK